MIAQIEQIVQYCESHGRSYEDKIAYVTGQVAKLLSEYSASNQCRRQQSGDDRETPEGEVYREGDNSHIQRDTNGGGE